MKKRRKNKKNRIPMIRIGLILAFLSLIFCLKLTENGVYTLYDLSTNTSIKTYKHFGFARWKMNIIEDNDSIVIKNEDNKIIALNNGIVNFNTKPITENTQYQVENTNETGYLNGNYGSDALYIDTSSDGKKILFLMSGVKGWVNADDVELYFYNTAPQSYYYRKNNALIHEILIHPKSNQTHALQIGPCPTFIQEGTPYFSYDGNWFYTNMDDMTMDVKSNSHEKAVNKEAYYNFYQYVPHRTKTTLSTKDIHQYLKMIGIQETASLYPCSKTQSALYGFEKDFIDIQEQTHINAAMMFSLACNESNYGQSKYAIEKHNLFGHAAYDDNPEQANAYPSIPKCLYEHAINFLQQGYANPNDFRYHGSWFGNKASGMNVMYASDPYWGEKAASFYFRLDQGKDASSIPVKTIKAPRKIKVYDKNRNNIYSYEKGEIISFLILDEKQGWYTIQSEAPIKNGKIDVQKPYEKNEIAMIKKQPGI